MIISLIAAMSQERVIGRQGKLPWHIPADLSRFKSITMGHTLVMGRKTFESIGRPLPGRKIVVLTRSTRNIEGCQTARSLTEAIAASEGDEEIFICGGEQVFLEALPFCQRVYLTVVHASYPGDVHFPELPEGFLEVQREELADAAPPLSFIVLEKVDRIEPGAGVQALREKGREAMRRQLFFLARRCLEQARALEEDPETASDLAFCLARTGGYCREALSLARSAVEADPKNPRFHLNLGRVQILAGAKEEGLMTLRKGVQLGGGQEILAELARSGARTAPPIRLLPRNHPVNKYLGLLLQRIGLR